MQEPNQTTEAIISDIDTSHVKDDFFAKFKKVLNIIPFAKEALTMFYCLLDSKTPNWVKASVGGALAYFILPLDLIPDFIPFAGFTDDAVVIVTTYKAVESNITEEHKKQAEDYLK